MTSNKAAGFRAEDRLEIMDLMYRWGRAVDRRDWALVRELFHPDGHDDHGMYRGNVEGLIAWLTQRHQTVEQSMHHIGNIVIDFSGPDDAVAETYVVGYQRYPVMGEETRIAVLGEKLGKIAAPVNLIMPGRYVDHVQRREGVWRILNRTTVFETMHASIVDESIRLNPDWTLARRDTNDTLFAALRAHKIKAA